MPWKLLVFEHSRRVCRGTDRSRFPMEHRTMGSITTSKMVPFHDTSKSFSFGLTSYIERIPFFEYLDSQNASWCLGLGINSNFADVSIKIFCIFLLMASFRFIQVFWRNWKIAYLSSGISLFFRRFYLQYFTRSSFYNCDRDSLTSRKVNLGHSQFTT